MKKPEREYPDIEFLETDTETIESNMIALYEELVNKELVKQGKHTGKSTGNARQRELSGITLRLGR